MSKVITPILFFLAAIGLFFTYLQPAYDVLLAFQAQEERLDDTLEESDKLIEVHDSLLRQYNSISSEDMKRLSQILPNDVDVVRLIVDIDALATKHRLTIRSFGVPYLQSEVTNTSSRNRVVAKADEGPVGSAILTIECDGEYADFKALLLDIEQSLSLLDLVSLNIAVSDMTRPNAVRETVYTLGLQTYWLK